MAILDLQLGQLASFFTLSLSSFRALSLLALVCLCLATGIELFNNDYSNIQSLSLNAGFDK